MSKILMVLLMLPMLAFATAKPITGDIELANGEFSQKIFDAISKNTPAKTFRRAGASVVSYMVADGFYCEKAVGARQTKPIYTCVLLAEGGWKYLGSHTYGSGSNSTLSEALFQALSVKPEFDEGFASKTIEYTIGDGRGGKERNLLTCIVPTVEGRKFGVRPTCQVIDAL